MFLENKKFGISGTALKLIAVVTMVIDHAATSVLSPMIIYMPAWGPINSANSVGWFYFYRFLRGVGRMAFPLYCFLLVEGFSHTKSRGRYALRLFAFALISEIPFDLALHGTFLYMGDNNVFFTLLIGLLAISLCEWIRGLLGNPGVLREFLWYVLTACVFVGAAALAQFVLVCDYGAAGIAAIFVLYLLRGQRLFGFAVAVVVLGLSSSTLEFWALVMLVPIFFYDGSRGRQNKYLGYAIYPAHLLVLGIIRAALGLGA
ncbi:MAG: conjugal transfer protein TraX [Clostridiales bacterium]|nr:conjugal transfer protein TraX [Clostridiales bacterium]